MAFDPISILVAGVAAAGAAVHGSPPLPPPVADVATNVVAAVEYAAPEWEAQLAPHIEQIPANISAQVKQLLPSEETLPAIPAPVAPVENIESAPAPAPVAVAPMVAPVVLAGPGSSAPSAVPPLTSLIPRVVDRSPNLFSIRTFRAMWRWPAKSSKRR